MPARSAGAERFDGFVHVSDGALVDGAGRRLLLRGVGLGNWLLPEGYMWKFEPGGPLSPRQIEAFIVELVGPTRAAEFWREFRERFVAREDIKCIADAGFDHVRLAINSRVLVGEDGGLIEAGFGLIDRVIEWCRESGVWVVLDLHGAPGGQTGTNIDDSPHGLPELFTEAHYAEQTVALWEAIAARYRDEAVVAAYDLLNEPLPNEYQFLYANELVSLYKKLTAAIRRIDPNHVIIYEGSHWSTNWSIFTEVWDPNSVLQCHKYWSPPDRPSVQAYVDKGAEFDLPVYMGETGENNLDWMQTAFELYESCGMSWNLWPWKKIDTLTSPCSVVPPSGWGDVVAYARGLGEKPTRERAWAILCELLDNLDVARCVYRTDVVNAVMRRAPLRIPASGFGFGGCGVAYQTSAGKPLAGFRSDDVVSMSCEQVDENGAPSFHHTGGARREPQEEIIVHLDEGDWVAYHFEVAEPSRFQVVVGLAQPTSAADTPIDLLIDNQPVGGLRRCEGGVEGATNKLECGRREARIVAKAAGVAVRWIDVLDPGASA